MADLAFTREVHLYRWIVFGAAAFYTVYMLVTGDYSDWGGPMRFLTIWALLISFWSASRMLAYTEHRILRYHDTLPSLAAVLNVMVVYLYWSLYFEDPNLVRGGDPIVWWKEYYLHLVGPVLQWIDVLFIRRGFRRPMRTLLALLAVVAAYVAWAELLVAPLNDSPAGTVTAGLPYPFLNDMTEAARLRYYATVSAGAVLVLGAFCALSAGQRRMIAARQGA